jgi:hypothetical protein
MKASTPRPEPVTALPGGSLIEIEGWIDKKPRPFEFGRFVKQLGEAAAIQGNGFSICDGGGIDCRRERLSLTVGKTSPDYP